MKNEIRLGTDVLPPGYTRCFVCGPENPVGLDVNDIRLDGGIVRASIAVRDDWQGYPGLLHGGIALSVLDEVMGYACRKLHGQWAATAKLESRFRRPMKLHEEYFAEAGADNIGSHRRFHCWARLQDADGNVCVETTGLFVSLSAAIAAQLDNHTHV